MPPEPPRPPERPEATGSWRPARPADGPGAEPPTIRTGSGSGSGSTSQRRAAAAVPLPVPGDRIDTFELEEAIGAGGMGAVFRATDLRLDRHVALKILPPEQSHDGEVVQRFYQEARAAARLDHENIARVYSIGHDGKYHYIAFEYIEGDNIRRRVAEHGPLTVTEAINYSLQIAGALVHASERGVVHRDIKPSNIIVTPQGRAKLVDMGLARRFERGGVDDGLTQSGMTLGTFDYISPEQARDPRDVDVRSDLYSLGCTMFHMLTGRPPFPEGTVLQKLLQHQEEPAPDVRMANPAVPADLAAILLKLMAKDRDRRYQTPEQLARDLLMLAGALGLRSVSPEGLTWMASGRAPGWERHLVWGVPTLALALVVGALVWWGQPGEPPASPDASPPARPIAAPARVASRGVETPSPTRPGPSPPTAIGREEAAPLAASPAIERTARAGDDLAALIASTPPGATITLADDGPFDLRPMPTATADLAGLARRDLTLKAAPDARPVLRVARGAGDPGRESALLRFVGGRVVLEGLEFDLDPGDRDAPMAAVFARDADLSVRRCLFRRSGPPSGRGRLAALSIRSTVAVGERPEPARVAACHFDGDQVGLLARGPAAIIVADATFGPGGPAVWLDNAPAAPAVPSRLDLRHVSLMADAGPAFRFAGTAAVVRVEDSALAPSRDERSTLVAIDDPGRLDWLGRDNLYGTFDTYLQPTRDPDGAAPVRSFADWQDGPDGPREADSTARGPVVWASADPTAALARKDPSAAFALGTAGGLDGAPGARRGPFGALAPPPAGLLAGLNAPGEATPRRATAEPREAATARTPARSTPEEAAAVPGLAGEDKPPPSAVEPSAEDKPPPMAVEVRPMPGLADPADATAAPTERPGEAKGESARPAEAVVRPPAEAPAGSPIRTESQLREALRRPSPRGATLTLAADADIALRPIDLPGNGSWVLQAEKGATRPTIRYRADDRAAAGAGADALAWPALFRLRAGSLELRGIDIVLPRDQAPASGRWAAFAIRAGTDLNLARCTATVEGNRVRSALVAIQAGDDAAEHGLARPDSSAALVRANACLLRGGGDLVDVDPGRRLDLEVENVVVATGGSLVHGHGLPRGQTAEPLKVVLRHASARDLGGLVCLESDPGEPELPRAEVVVFDSILATDDEGEPLVRVLEQGEADASRDRIRWQGRAVAYHQITTYRSDQSAQEGTMPVRFDRPAWELAVGPREVDPVHEDVKFVRDWDPRRPLWSLTPDDVRLAPDSPAAAAGPDLKLIPEPPSS